MILLIKYYDAMLKRIEGGILLCLFEVGTGHYMNFGCFLF